MHNLDLAARFLIEQEREDLAALLAFSTFDLKQTPIGIDKFSTAVTVSSPESFNDCLNSLWGNDKDLLLNAVVSTSIPVDGNGEPPSEISFKPSAVAVPDEHKLYPELLLLRKELGRACSGLTVIHSLNDKYTRRYRWIDKALKTRGWDNPVSFPDLLQWDEYSTKNLKTAPFKKQYLDAIFKPLFRRLITYPMPTLANPRGATGWERVDRGLGKLHRSLATAHDEEDFQAIGLTCREVLISVGQAVYDRNVHGTVDGVFPTQTDGARMIEAFINHVATGESNANLRRHAKASMNLAVELQHKRTADFKAAALCLEATVTVANIASILSGRRTT